MNARMHIAMINNNAGWYCIYWWYVPMCPFMRNSKQMPQTNRKITEWITSEWYTMSLVPNEVWLSSRLVNDCVIFVCLILFMDICRSNLHYSFAFDVYNHSKKVNDLRLGLWHTIKRFLPIQCRKWFKSKNSNFTWINGVTIACKYVVNIKRTLDISTHSFSEPFQCRDLYVITHESWSKFSYNFRYTETQLKIYFILHTAWALLPIHLKIKKRK